MKNVMLWAGAGQIGMAIARRMGAGMKIIVGDKKYENAQAIAKTMNEAGFDVLPMEMDLSSRTSIQSLIAEGQRYGEIKMLVNAAGVSPSQAPVEAILKVDLYGTAVLLEEIGKVIAPGGVGVTISSQSGWRMPALTARQDEQLATAPTEELLSLDFLLPENIRDTLRHCARHHCYPAGIGRVQRPTGRFLQEYVRQMPRRSPWHGGRDSECGRASDERQGRFHHRLHLLDGRRRNGQLFLRSAEATGINEKYSKGGVHFQKPLHPPWHRKCTPS